VSTQVIVDGFLEKTFSATFKIVNYYHFVKGEKGEYFKIRKDFKYRPWNFIKSGF
jgi:hypothetical protein